MLVYIKRGSPYRFTEVLSDIYGKGFSGRARTANLGANVYLGTRSSEQSTPSPAEGPDVPVFLSRVQSSLSSSMRWDEEGQGFACQSFGICFQSGLVHDELISCEEQMGGVGTRKFEWLLGWTKRKRPVGREKERLGLMVREAKLSAPPFSSDTFREVSMEPEHLCFCDFSS